MLHDLLEKVPPMNEEKSSSVDNRGKTDKFNVHQPHILIDSNITTTTYVN